MTWLTRKNLNVEHLLFDRSVPSPCLGVHPSLPSTAVSSLGSPLEQPLLCPLVFAHVMRFAKFSDPPALHMPSPIAPPPLGSWITLPGQALIMYPEPGPHGHPVLASGTWHSQGPAAVCWFHD